MSDDNSEDHFPEDASLIVEAGMRDILYNGFSKMPVVKNKQMSASDQIKWTNRINPVVRRIFDNLIFDINAILNRQPHFAVIGGLRFDENNSLFRAIASSLGEVFDPFQTTWSTALTKLQPMRDQAFSGYGTLTEQLHTDGTNWPSPNRYTCLLCIRPDQRGYGKSWILDVDTLWRSFKAKTAASLLRCLAETPVPWQIAKEMGGGVHWQPIISNERVIRWMRYTIECGLTSVDAIQRIAIQNLLDEFDKHINEVEGGFKFLLRSHDLLIFDNYKCLHARTPIAFPKTSEREFLRAKVVDVASQLGVDLGLRLQS